MRTNSAVRLRSCSCRMPVASLEQVGLVTLEQLGARVGLEDVLQSAGVVRSGSQPRLIHHLGDGAAQERDRARALRERLAGEQAGDDLEPEHFAVVVEAVHQHRLHVGRAVDGRAHRRLRDSHQLGAEQVVARPRLQPAFRNALERRDLGVAQQPQAGFPVDPETGVGRIVLVAIEPDRAPAEEGEVPVAHPPEKGLRLGRGVSSDGRRQRVEGVGELLAPAAHRLPVSDRGAYVGEHREQGVAAPRRAPPRAAPAPAAACATRCRWRRSPAPELQQLAVVAALDLEDGVHQKMDRDLTPLQLRHRRIEQERHVVVHDLDHRVRAAPAVALEVRVVDPHLRAVAFSTLGELPHRERRTVEVVLAGRHQVFVRYRSCRNCECRPQRSDRDRARGAAEPSTLGFRSART